MFVSVPTFLSNGAHNSCQVVIARCVNAGTRNAADLHTFERLAGPTVS